MVSSNELGSERHDQDPRERVSITIGSLLSDNHSEEANGARHIWMGTKEEKGLIVVIKCSDARTILPNPDNCVVVNYISEARTPPEPQELLLKSPGVIGGIVLAHFDGETVAIGKAPEGCGGLKAKKERADKSEITGNLDRFIKEHIAHEDPILQACLSAMEIIKHTEKPILVGAQDHRTGEVIPVALFYSRGNEREMIANQSIFDSLFGHKYDPAVFYKEGIPQIGEDRLTPFFKAFLNDSREKKRKLKEEYPDIYDSSKVQDPPLVILSTNIIPFSTCFPKIGGRPGTAFEVFVPRSRIGGGISIKDTDLEPSLCQIEYPIGQSLQNHGKDEKPFASTNTILIDTEQISWSIALVHKLVDQYQPIKEWAEIEGHKILVSETIDGVITNISEIDIAEIDSIES